jgi:hypothetical protein
MVRGVIEPLQRCCECPGGESFLVLGNGMMNDAFT